MARTYTGLPHPHRLYIYTLVSHSISPMIQQYKLRGEIFIGLATLFSYVLTAPTPLATPTPSQVCRSDGAHLRTRQFSRFKSSSTPYLIFSPLKVGQINTSSVPRGIAMVCHMSRPGFAINEPTWLCPGKSEHVTIWVRSMTKVEPSAITSPLFQANLGSRTG
jgi:hypothetical protein